MTKEDMIKAKNCLEQSQLLNFTFESFFQIFNKAV